MRADLEKIVWTAGCHPKIRSWKYVLLNLCHHANAEGEAYPGVSTIEQETGFSKRAVVDALAGLEKLKIIKLKGRCGQHNRVSIYDISDLSTYVDNLANGAVSACLQLSNGAVSSKKPALNGAVSSMNGAVSSTRSILGRKEVSKLVCVGGNGAVSAPFVNNSKKAGQNASAEGRPPPHGSRPRQAGLDAPAGKCDEDFKTLVRTIGWKPRTDAARRYCMQLVFDLGASREEAEEFVRYNAIRRWTCCDYGTVNDAAKAWAQKWREDYPDSFAAERERRARARSTKVIG